MVNGRIVKNDIKKSIFDNVIDYNVISYDNVNIDSDIYFDSRMRFKGECSLFRIS